LQNAEFQVSVLLRCNKESAITWRRPTRSVVFDERARN
jgi:hypothetical protein